MDCVVLKSTKRNELYLFLPKEDDFPNLPESLRQHFGRPEFVMKLELTPERKLARSDATEVIRGLDERGYYLQMPPAEPEF